MKETDAYTGEDWYCAACGSSHVLRGEPQVAENGAYAADCECPSCGREWRVLYTPTTVAVTVESDGLIPIELSHQRYDKDHPVAKHLRMYVRTTQPHTSSFINTARGLGVELVSTPLDANLDGGRAQDHMFSGFFRLDDDQQWEIALSKISEWREAVNRINAEDEAERILSTVITTHSTDTYFHKDGSADDYYAAVETLKELCRDAKTQGYRHTIEKMDGSFSRHALRLTFSDASLLAEKTQQIRALIRAMPGIRVLGPVAVDTATAK
ncbi:TPA: hypothetical protein ACMFQN_005207 [Pseudomonas aeruginosa]